MTKSITYFEGAGLMTPRTRAYTNEDLKIGDLVALEDGKLVKASSKTSKKAIGVITKGSMATPDSPRYYTGTNVLLKGESQEVYKFFTIQNVPKEEVDFSTAKYGDVVYLGEDGKVTTTKPTSGISQIVGLVGNTARQEVDCTLIFPAKTIAGE